MVAEGICWLAIEGEPPAWLHRGDCLLLPHGKPFVIASDLDLPPIDERKIVSGIARYQSVLPVTPGEEFLLLGTHFEFRTSSRKMTHHLEVSPSQNRTMRAECTINYPGA